MIQPSRLALALAVHCACAGPLLAASIAVPATVAAPEGYRLVADYGSWRLFEGEASRRPASAWVLADATELKFDRLHIDTAAGPLRAPAGFALSEPSGPALQLIQFVGPPTDAWLQRVRDSGAVPVQAVARFGYLVWADAKARASLDGMARAATVLRFSTPLPGFLKLDQALDARLAQGQAADTQVTAVLVRYRHGDDEARRRALALQGIKPLDDWTPQLGNEIAQVRVNLAEVRRLIEEPDVLWIGEYFAPRLHDEVQAQLIRADFNADRSAPAGPGYLDWLQGLGFPADAASYPLVDVTDSGVGDGSTGTNDPTLHVSGEAANASRMVFSQHCTADTGPVDGHGHLNANIAFGFDVRDNFATPGARFPGDFQSAQGIHPFGRFGATRVFAPFFDLSACGNSYGGLIASSYAAGARISTNSWGCAQCAGQYDVGAQAYDAGTRDADPLAAGNQELITIFSAGNNGDGPGTVGSPGNGKNMITVGASENARPIDEDGAWTDGCRVDSSGADDAMDMAFFSSRGPAPGGRAKPDLVAPGTHIIGTQADSGVGEGICDGTHPTGNATFAASSGTSHAAPAVAAIGSLAWWWIEQGQGSLEFDSGSASAPSPALMKAWLIAHPTYLDGQGANDDLPSFAQGFGMPDLDAMFANTPTLLVNQDHVLGDSGAQWTQTVQRVDPALPLRVVLAWTDAPGALGTSPEVNDLDLEVVGGADTYRGNHFDGAWSQPGGDPDSVNNVEAVFLPPGPAASITLRVRATTIAGDGLPANADATDQDFALVCSNCAKAPGFALHLAPTAQAVCSSDGAASFDLSTQSILDFSTPAGISVAGLPPGSTASVAPNPLAMPGNGTLSLSNLAAAPAGRYGLDVTATAAGIQRHRHASLDLVHVVPSAPGLGQPVDGAVNVPLRPELGWAAVAQAQGYRLEIARDAAFTDIVYATTTNTNTHAVTTTLDTRTRYYWRVRADNACGQGAVSAIRSFETAPPPGQCPTAMVPTTLLEVGFDSGDAGWTHGGDHDTWALVSDRSHSPPNAFRAQDVAYDSNQILTSPAISLPAGQNPITLGFWSHQWLENRIGGCYDGAMIELSRDGGTNWLPLPPARVLVGGYDGPISTRFANPAGGRQAWCGDPRDWSETLISLDAEAGQTLRLRFRVATDASTGRVPDGFHLDDIHIQTCAPAQDGIFADGFESG